MSIVMAVTLKVKPETYDGFVAGLGEMLAETRTRPGCLGLCLAGNPADSSVLLYERWDSIEDQQRYIAWRTERGEMDGMAAVLREEPVFQPMDDLFAG